MTDQQAFWTQGTSQTNETSTWGVFGGNPDVVIDTSAFQQETTQIPTEPEIILDHSVFTETPAEQTTISPPASEVKEEVEIPVREEKPSPEEISIQEEAQTSPIPTSPVEEKNNKEVLPAEKKEEEKFIVTEKEPEVNYEETSDLRKKFNDLENNVKNIFKGLSLKNDDLLDIIGADNDKITTLYQFSLPDNEDIVIKRIETDKETEENTFNELRFALETEENKIQIFLDEVLLFDEDEVLADQKKKLQVMEKINKFIFLTGEKLKDIEREIKLKEEDEKERRRLQDIFRNF